MHSLQYVPGAFCHTTQGATEPDIYGTSSQPLGKSTHIFDSWEFHQKQLAEWHCFIVALNPVITTLSVKS